MPLKLPCSLNTGSEDLTKTFSLFYRHGTIFLPFMCSTPGFFGTDHSCSGVLFDESTRLGGGFFVGLVFFFWGWWVGRILLGMMGKEQLIYAMGLA